MSTATTTLEAYKKWAPLYPPFAHNPLMCAEQRAMIEHWPKIIGNRVLDLACGSGRYTRLLIESCADVIALDFCMPMLLQVSGAARVCASMMQLPFADNVFDTVISGLALGHATDLRLWMAEMARVLRKDGTLLYSDFHPEAARAGLLRSFKDQENRAQIVPHCRYDLSSQREAVEAAILKIEIVCEIRVGFELKEAFPKSELFYRQWHGLPIVLVVRARK